MPGPQGGWIITLKTCAACDCERLPVGGLVAAVGSFARVIDVPLPADIEGGYSDDPAAVARLVAEILDAGAVGINIEDESSPPDLLCAKIAAARQSAQRAGI